MIENFSFYSPEFLWLLLAIPLIVFWRILNSKSIYSRFNISNTTALVQSQTFKSRLFNLLPLLQILSFALFVIALARPRFVDVTLKTKITKGIDIVMAVDVSGSMLAKDLKPNRLEALKRVAKTFTKNRINDRIGIVVYSGESYTKTPVTSDKTIIQNSIDQIKYDPTILKDGTGIGIGLATAINRIKDSKAKSKIIILLTDGVNNSGTINPIDAANIAKEHQIKVYTIGVGTNGNAPFPVSILPNGKFQYQKMKVEIDEKLMKQIAKITGAQYYRATSNKKLTEIYQQIDQLEKTEIAENKYYNYDEKYRYFLLSGLGVLLAFFILKHSIFRSITS